MEQLVMFLDYMGLSIILALMVYVFFIIILVIIEALSSLVLLKKLLSPYKVGKRVKSPVFGIGKIVLVNSDNIVVQFSFDYQTYDIRGKALLEVKGRKGLTSTIRDNIKAI